MPRDRNAERVRQQVVALTLADAMDGRWLGGHTVQPINSMVWQQTRSSQHSRRRGFRYCSPAGVAISLRDSALYSKYSILVSVLPKMRTSATDLFEAGNQKSPFFP